MDDGLEPPQREIQDGVSRRTVTKAMAWAVPVIGVSAAVPAYAASQVNISFAGGGCKLPGNSSSTYKGYAFLITVLNSSSIPITIDIISITRGVVPNQVSLGTTALVNLANAELLPDPIKLEPNENILRGALVTSGAPNSQNNTLTIQYTVNGGSVITRSTESVTETPPINGSSCRSFTAGEKLILAATIGTGVPPWEPETLYEFGDVVFLYQPDPGGFVSAANGGFSGDTEPLLPAAPGGTVVDNDVTWQRPG